MARKHVKGLIERKGPHLLEALREGLSLSAACKVLSMSEQTVYSWMQKASKPRAAKHYREFAEAFEAARAQGIKVLIAKLDAPEVERQKIEEHDGDGNLVKVRTVEREKYKNSAEFLLARMHPELFSEKVTSEIALDKLRNAETDEKTKGPNLAAIIERFRTKK